MFDLESTQTVERRRRAAQADHAALMRAAGRDKRPRLRAHAAIALRALAERLDPGARERFEEVRA